MSERHLAKGADLPPLDKGKLRIYSMVFCPFAQRTRLVLAHKKIPHETVNVNLKSKPDWFLERNPLGLVPTLEIDGKVVYESDICDDYLDEVYPENKLLPRDPYEKARQKMIMDAIGKVGGASLKVARATEEEKVKALEELYKGLHFFETSLKSDFFGGDKVGMTDLHIWPWFERFDAHQDDTPHKVIPEDKFPKLVAWLKRMKETPAVKATIIEPKAHQAFRKGYMSGQPNYDMLIDGTL